MNLLFVCKRCQHVDLADLAESEVQRINAEHRSLTVPGNDPRQFVFEPLVCTMCLTHRWHHQFPYKRYDPATDRDHVCNPPLL